MQFRRRCRLRDIPTWRGPACRAAILRVAALPLALLMLAGPSSASPLRLAQLGPNSGPGPSYGYQPYNDRNPTGFFHPNGMGYGHYYLTQKHHAPRFRAFRARKFRGA